MGVFSSCGYWDDDAPCAMMVPRGTTTTTCANWPTNDAIQGQRGKVLAWHGRMVWLGAWWIPSYTEIIAWRACNGEVTEDWMFDDNCEQNSMVIRDNTIALRILTWRRGRMRRMIHSGQPAFYTCNAVAARTPTDSELASFRGMKSFCRPFFRVHAWAFL